MKTLLITGAAGSVATNIRPWLREHYQLRLLDLRAAQDPAANESVIVGDITDRATVREAAKGTAGIVHLACRYALDIPFEATLDTNYRALLYLLDACREFSIPRFVFASSHHAVGHHRVAHFAGDDAAVAPDGFYALSKAFGESACALYAHRHGIQCLSIRIGNADTQIADERRLHIWVSGRDLAQLVRIGLEHPGIANDLVYGVSQCPDPFFDNRRAAELGYVPQDDASAHIAPDFLRYASMPPSAGADYIGGPYVPQPLHLGDPEPGGEP